MLHTTLFETIFEEPRNVENREFSSSSKTFFFATELMLGFFSLVTYFSNKIRTRIIFLKSHQYSGHDIRYIADVVLRYEFI